MKANAPLFKYLPERTRKLFERLSKEPLMEGLVLVGGSAMAIQIGHRISGDLDFVALSSRLPSDKIESLTQKLQNEGMDVSLTTAQSAISQFKINTGDNMLDYVRDYAVEGAKLTFFAQGFNTPVKQLEYLRDLPEAFPKAHRFKVMGIEGLSAMKTLVLGARARSRDIYDLKELVANQGFSIKKAKAIVENYAPASQRDFERHKALLTGIFPLDKQDEGFETLGIKPSMEEIYSFFKEKVAEFEKERAKEILQQQ